MPDPVSTLALATGGAFLGKFVGPAAEHLGKLALERAQQLGAKAEAMLTAVGREPQPVEPKLLLPLVQAASLETDEVLADKWAALLANAADPAQERPVHPGFVEMLRQLTPTDATVLTRLYQGVYAKEQDLLHYELQRVITQRMAVELQLPEKRFALSVEILLRLRLCAPPTPRKSDVNTLGGTAAAARQVCPTVLGLEFLAACTPPTK